VAAIEKLRTEVDRLPAGGSLQARWVKQDLLGRMATLQIEVGEPERALGTVKKGLEVSPEPSVPRSNLYIAEGQALTALGRKDEAIEPYYQALLVNEALMQEALKSEGTP
jgi:Flp pilus assembly protein TadD